MSFYSPVLFHGILDEPNPWTDTVSSLIDRILKSQLYKRVRKQNPKVWGKEKEVAQLSAVLSTARHTCPFMDKGWLQSWREGYILSLKLILRGSFPPGLKRGRGTSQTGWTWLKKELPTCGHLNKTPKAQRKEKRPKGGEGIPQSGAEQSILGARDPRGMGS